MFKIVCAIDWQYAELASSASDAVLCTVLVCKIKKKQEADESFKISVNISYI